MSYLVEESISSLYDEIFDRYKEYDRRFSCIELYDLLKKSNGSYIKINDKVFSPLIRLNEEGFYRPHTVHKDDVIFYDFVDEITTCTEFILKHYRKDIKNPETGKFRENFTFLKYLYKNKNILNCISEKISMYYVQ